MNKKKILFVTPSLSSGGAEKVMLNIIRNIDYSEYTVDVLIVTKKGQLFKQLPDNVRTQIIGKRVLFAIPQMLKYLRRDYDIVFSIIGHLNLAIAFLKRWFNLKFKHIARENAVYSETVMKKGKLRKSLLLHLYKRYLPHIDLVIFQSDFVLEEAKKLFNYNCSNSKVIGNPIDVNRVQELAEEPTIDFEFSSNKIYLVCLGRLEIVKRFNLCIDIVKELDDDFELLIIGEGSQEEFLRDYSMKQEVKDRVHFLGFKKNPYPYLKNSDYLLITSSRETYPNVALESLTVKTPVLSLEIPGGIREICRSKTDVHVFRSINDIEDFLKTRTTKFDGKNVDSLTINKYIKETIMMY